MIRKQVKIDLRAKSGKTQILFSKSELKLGNQSGSKGLA